MYEEIWSGIWSYNGVFHLVDSWRERDDYRTVFKFKLLAVEGEEDFAQPVRATRSAAASFRPRSNWRCGSAMVGSARFAAHPTSSIAMTLFPLQKAVSLIAGNVQLLCARHNLEKRDRIE